MWPYAAVVYVGKCLLCGGQISMLWAIVDWQWIPELAARFLYCGKRIACFLCSIALHLSVCTVQSIQEPLSSSASWDGKSLLQRHRRPCTRLSMAHWYQLHHNFITSSSLRILLTLTFYRDWQHWGRDAWQCQRLNPFKFSLLFNSCSQHIVICWWSVVFVRTNGVNCAESLQLQWDYIGKKRRGGLKKQGDGRLQSVKVCRAAFEWRPAYCFDKCSLRRTCEGGCHSLLSSLRYKARHRGSGKKPTAITEFMKQYSSSGRNTYIHSYTLTLLRTHCTN